jgi:hypothetical protein
MRPRFSITAILVLCGAMLSCPCYVAAQPPGQVMFVRNAAEVAMVNANFQGLALTVQTKDGRPMVLKFDDKVKVELTGTADLDFLPYIRSPMLLKIKTEITTKTKTSTGAVKEMEISTVSPENKEGVQSDEASGLLSPTQKKGPPPALQTVEIKGVPTAYKNGVLTIQGMKVQIDPEAKITVNADAPSALAIIPPGTKFEILYRVVPNVPNPQAYPPVLEAVKVKLEEPYSAPKKPGAKKAEPPKTDPKSTAKPGDATKPADPAKPADGAKPADAPKAEAPKEEPKKK